MKMTLTRTSYGVGYTTGVLCEGERLLAHTLEPERRDLRREPKVPGKTAIPEGRYRIKLSPSRRFNRLMPYLMEVPNFTGVMLHCGNTVEDTSGCILVGERSGHERLNCSRKTFERLMCRLGEADSVSEPIWLEVV